MTKIAALILFSACSTYAPPIGTAICTNDERLVRGLQLATDYWNDAGLQLAEPCTGDMQVFARVEEIDDKDIVGQAHTYNIKWPFIVVDPMVANDKNDKDVAEMLAHELGHCLGLGHSKEESIMWKFWMELPDPPTEADVQNAGWLMGVPGATLNATER